MSRTHYALLALGLSLSVLDPTGIHAQTFSPAAEAVLQQDDSSDPAAQRARDLTGQAHTFAEGTRELQRAAKSALADNVGRTVMIDTTAQLAIAAERFEKSLLNKGDLKQRQGDFADVDKAWTRVVFQLGLLKPAENAQLLRSASRVDRGHERLYRLLEIKGKRPSLSVQS